MACAHCEDTDQTGQMPSLIRVFAVHLKKACVLSYPLSAQRRLWSDWANAQADLNLCWATVIFCWFCHEAAHMMMIFMMILWLLYTVSNDNANDSDDDHNEMWILRFEDTKRKRDKMCTCSKVFLWRTEHVICIPIVVEIRFYVNLNNF